MFVELRAFFRRNGLELTLDSHACAHTVTADDLAVVKSEFLLLSERGIIAKKDFVAWLERTYLRGVHATILERFFVLFDLDATGYIQYKEFLVAMYVLQWGDAAVKRRQIFNLYDLDASERLTRKNFIKITRALARAAAARTSRGENAKLVVEPLLQLHTHSAFRFVSMDKDTEYMSFREWQRYASTSESVAALLRGMSRPSPGVSSKDQKFGPFEYKAFRSSVSSSNIRRAVARSGVTPVNRTISDGVGRRSDKLAPAVEAKSR